MAKSPLGLLGGDSFGVHHADGQVAIAVRVRAHVPLGGAAERLEEIIILLLPGLGDAASPSQRAASMAARNPAMVQ